MKIDKNTHAAVYAVVAHLSYSDDKNNWIDHPEVGPALKQIWAWLNATGDLKQAKAKLETLAS